MRRLWLPYLLIPAVLLATAGLAYYSLQLQIREHGFINDTVRELAEEKAVGIQTTIEESEAGMFAALADDGRMQEIPALMKDLPLVSVLVLDADFQVIPGGHHTKRDRKRFLELFSAEILPELHLPQLSSSRPEHVQLDHDGLPYLFAAVRRQWDGQLRYVVLEYDLPYLVSTVFPQFFNVHSKSLYQVVDENGALVYGFPFQGVPEQEIVEVPFGQTLTRWRLRAVQKEARAMIDRQSRQATVDGVMIGLALLVIVAGLAGLVGLMRYERRLNQLKSDFISNVSHELKTPLSIISMFGELLSLGRVKGPEQSKEYADIIRRESMRLSRLIDNVLDFAKIEAGAHVYEFEDQEDLGAVVTTALEISKPRLSRDNMEVDLDIEVDLPPARLDLNAMTLAVLNLVDNAIKYASDGKRVMVSVKKQGDGMEVAVKDFGPGVPAAETEMIFERFYRSRAARKRPIRGSGIGLALVRDVATAHGGTVAVESAPGQGATFRLWIPAQKTVN